MSMDFLDIFMIAILGFAVVMFATGNGERLLDMFGGRNRPSGDEYNKPKMIRASGILCTILLADELIMYFLGDKFPILVYITIVITIAALVGYIWYLRKYAKK